MVVEIDGVRYAETPAGTRIPMDELPLAEDVRQQEVDWGNRCCTLLCWQEPHECWGTTEPEGV